jgi:hypothetical protein
MVPLNSERTETWIIALTGKIGLMGFNFYTFVHFSEQGRGREEQYGGVATCGTPEALVAIATSANI